MTNLFKIFFWVLLCIGCFAAKGSVDSSLISSNPHREILSKYKKNAEDFCANNLNKFGLYTLQKYDIALDSLYKLELDDTVKAFKGVYERTHASRNTALDSLNSSIKQLTTQKEAAQTKFNKLLSKASIAFLIWLGIIILLIQIRTRTLKKTQAGLDKSKLMLVASEQSFVLGNDLLQFTKSQVEKIKTVHELISDTSGWMAENPLTDSGFTKEEADRIQNKIKSLTLSGAINQKLATTVSSMENEAGSDKVPASLNQLCDQCMDAVYYGIKEKDSTFNYTIAKDLEKNLPAIKVVPEAVIYLLLNVLNNAFQAVYDRSKHDVKGYIPKVTISTRVLPRFLQIRIKDNGNGMTDDTISEIYESFYTTRIPEEGAGLGMYFAKKIISDLHNGEIKIESRVGDGTDIYLKFFTS